MHTDILLRGLLVTLSSLHVLCQCQGDVGTLLPCLSKPLTNESYLHPVVDQLA